MQDVDSPSLRGKSLEFFPPSYYYYNTRRKNFPPAIIIYLLYVRLQLSQTYVIVRYLSSGHMSAMGYAVRYLPTTVPQVRSVGFSHEDDEDFSHVQGGAGT